MSKIIQRTPEQVIDLWVKALRSGKYKQTQRTLQDATGFCCLGVLCDLSAKDGGRQWDLTQCTPRFAGKLSFPPDYINDYLGLSHEQAEELAVLNDRGHDFKEIATKIVNLKNSMTKNRAKSKAATP